MDDAVIQATAVDLMNRYLTREEIERSTVVQVQLDDAWVVVKHRYRKPGVHRIPEAHRAMIESHQATPESIITTLDARSKLAHPQVTTVTKRIDQRTC